MKKSLLIASLAVISMNVLGMNLLDHNNPVGNNPGHVLTPDSSPENNSNLMESIRESVAKFFQGDLPENKTQELVNTMFSLIISQETTQLRSRIFESEQKIRNLEEQKQIDAQLILEKNSEISRLSQQNQQLLSSGFELNASIAEKDTKISELNNSVAEKDTKISELNNSVAEKDNTISGLNNQIEQFQSVNQLLLRDVQQLLLQNKQKAQFVSKLDKQNRKLNGSLISVKRMFRNIAKQTFRKGSVRITKSALEDFVIRVYNSSNKTNVTINELFEGNTAEGAIVLSNPLNLRSFAKRPAPEDDSVSQPSAQRRRIDPGEATGSTSHLRQPVEIRDENAVNRQNDVEQIDQNLADLITLNYWSGASLNPEKCIKLFSYLTDPNYEGGITKAYLTKATTAINMWNAITDNEREYLSILAKNIHSPLEEFPIQDQERINKLETAIRADRNILPGENLKIMVNTGPRECDLIEFVDDVRDRESNIQAARYYKSSDLTKPLITVLAQTNWPAQPCFATEEELNNFEQSVKSFVDEYNQRRSELENSNDPDRDKLVKTNLVSTVLNLRRFGIGDRLIANKLNLFSSNDENEAIQKFKSLYPCLQKGAPFNIARKKTIEVLKWQGKSNKEISAILGMGYGRVYKMWKSINSH